MNSRFLYGVISILLAAVIAFIAIPAITAKTNGTTEIVRVKENIEVGQRIEKTAVELISVGTHNLPDTVAHTMEDVVGKYATAALRKDDYILSSKVSFTPLTSDIQLNNIPSGRVAISVTVKTLASGLSDKLQPGDVIRFYHFLDSAQAIPELQFVQVISVTDAKGVNVDNAQMPDTTEDGEEKPQTATITVMATPKQALLLTGLENDGQLHVALVARGNEELTKTLLDQQDAILDPDAKQEQGNEQQKSEEAPAE